jgi:hypothetical protein
MRVFILCTGRSGSTAIIKACEGIKNFTCGHETLSHKFGKDRFDYPDNHIEADNRLAWFLGSLDKKFGDDAVYIHLIRDKDATVKSYNQRWKSRLTIVKAFAEGILMTPVELLDDTSRLLVCSDYYDTVNSNIELFLKNKTQKIEIHLDNIKQGFQQLWNLIGAQGDLDLALQSFDEHHNKSMKKNIFERIQARLYFYFRIYAKSAKL